MKLLPSLLFAALTCLVPLLHGDEAEAERLTAVIAGAVEAIYGEDCVDHPSEDKQARVRAVIEEEYDLNVIIRRAIGRKWRLMKPEEQVQVLELVKQLVVKTYVRGMDGKGRPLVEVGKVVTVSEKRIEIPSVVTLEDQTIHVLYRLGKMKTGWQIYDIVAEDISVVSNYRQQIDDHFRKGTGAELIDKLEELLAKDTLDEDTKI